MYKKHFLMQLLLLAFLLLKNIKAEELFRNNLFGVPTTENDVANSNLQTRLQAYYYGASTNQHNQQGYNYIAPAPTPSGYFTTTYSTQAAPTTVNLHSQDNNQVGKTTNTQLLPRLKSLEAQPNTKAQPTFYIQQNVASQSKFGIQHSETKDFTENYNPTQNKNTQTNIESAQYQPAFHFRLSSPPPPQETQQNWRPLLEQQRFQNILSPLDTELPLNQGSRQESESVSTDLNQFNDVVSTNPKSNLTSFRPYFSNKELPLECERHLSNLQNRETGLRSLNKIQSQVAAEATQFPQEKTPVAFSLPSSVSSSGTSRNLRTSNSLNVLNQKRLNIIKSLLAEYLALIQSNVPNALQAQLQASLNNDVTVENDIDNTFSAAAPAFQFPDYSPTGLQSPALNKFIDAMQYRTQQYQTRPIIPAIRKPHSFYGSPFINGLNPISEK